MPKICDNSNFWMYVSCSINLIAFTVFSGILSVPVFGAEDSPLLLYLHSSPHILIRRTVAGILLVISVLEVLFSISAIIGIKKVKPLLLGLYVGYGAFTAICLFILGLLLLIASRWVGALAAFLWNGFYIYDLVVIHNGYESMMRGNASGDASCNLQHNLLEEDILQEG